MLARMAARRTSPAAQPVRRAGERIDLHPGSSIREAARLILLNDAAALLRYRPGMALDAEAVHRMRVARRRTLSTLRLFEAELPARIANTRKALKTVLGGLASVRDLDVQSAQLDAVSDGLATMGREPLDALREHMQTQSAAARLQMRRTLESRAAQRLLATLRTGLQENTWTGPRGSELPVVSVLPERLRQRYCRLRKRGKRIHEGSPADELHEVRRRAKHLRDALAPFTGWYGEPAQRLQRSLERLQELLGRHQDAHVATMHLEQWVTTQPQLAAQTVFLMGRLAEHHCATMRRMRRRLPKAWRRIDKRWKALARALRCTPTRPARTHDEPARQPGAS